MGTSILLWGDARREGAARVVKPSGRVDVSTAGMFGDRLSQEIEAAVADGAGRLVIDLSGIDYMSSQGLRGLTLAQRKATENKVTIVLAQASEPMREILAISRYDKIFKVFAGVAEAAAG